MWDELVPGLPAEERVEVVEKGEALLVGDAREGIVGVSVLQVRNELRELVSRAELRDRVREGLPADDGGEGEVGFAVDCALDLGKELVRGSNR